MKENLIEDLNRLHAQVCGALSDANRILILHSLAEGLKKRDRVSQLFAAFPTNRIQTFKNIAGT